MPRQLPPLLSVRAFEAAARHGGFARAGEELCVTSGAVGHQVRLLEEWLGTPLFMRGARSVQLTDIGRRYFLEIERLMDELERASLGIRQAADSPEVTVTAMPSFVTRWLMPRLGEFRQLHPDIEVRLLASVPAIDFSRERVDVAIRLGLGPYPGLVAEKLMSETFLAVGQPSICAPLRTVDDVLRATLLHDEYEARIPEQVDWVRWCRMQGVHAGAARLRQGPSFSHTYLTLDAAIAGQGVAVASDVLAADAVRQGLLAIAPGNPVPGPYSYHLLTTRAATARPPVDAFCRWLRSAARSFSEAGWA